MSVVVYPALVTPAQADGLQGRFVDFPALTVSAASPAELIRDARDALTAELQRLEAQGETWPEPSALLGLEVPPGGSAILVDVSVDDTPVRLTISLGERLLKRIDLDAEARSMTRSGYLALGARRLLGEGGGSFGTFGGAGSGLGGETGRKLEDEIAALGRRVNETLGPNSPVGRTLADLDAMALDGLRRLGGEVRSAMKGRPRAGGPEEHKPREDRTGDHAEGVDGR